jgi:N6-adenosine-specific RNA methylase IME4
VFEFSTIAFTWLKTNPSFDAEAIEQGIHLKDFHRGNGHWTAANVEVCLLLRKGAPPRLATDVDELVIAPRGDHSAKPEEVRARIERLVGGLYLELFARSERKGWTVWGNETPEARDQVSEDSEGETV